MMRGGRRGGRRRDGRRRSNWCLQKRNVMNRRREEGWYTWRGEEGRGMFEEEKGNRGRGGDE